MVLSKFHVGYRHSPPFKESRLLYYLFPDSAWPCYAVQSFHHLYCILRSSDLSFWGKQYFSKLYSPVISRWMRIQDPHSIICSALLGSQFIASPVDYAWLAPVAEFFCFIRPDCNLFLTHCLLSQSYRVISNGSVVLFGKSRTPYCRFSQVSTPPVNLSISCYPRSWWCLNANSTYILLSS